MKPNQQFLVRIFEILFGTTLKKLAAFGLAYLALNEISTETVNRFAESVGSFFSSEQIRELVVSSINLIGEYMGTDDLRVKMIIGLITLFLVLWLIYEEYLKYTFHRRDVPAVEVREGKLYFFGVPQEKLGWLAYRRLHWAYSMDFRLRVLPIHVPPEERLKLKNYSKLQYRLPGDASPAGKKRPSKAGVVRYIFQHVLSDGNGSPITFLLGDSGMGKSMALLKVYYDYLFPSWKKKKGSHPAFLIRYRDFEEKWKQWEVEQMDFQQAILLIDALDEDAAVYGSPAKLAASLEELKNCGFHRVLITCREQFFASRLQEPGEDVRKVYIAGFSGGALRRYVRRRFPLRGWRFRNLRLRSRARRIIRQHSDIAARPLLIDWICELVAELEKGQLEQARLDYPYQLYEHLVQLWYRREKNTLERFGFQLAFEQVREWMEALAIHFYENPELNNRLGEHLLKGLFSEQVSIDDKETPGKEQARLEDYLQQGRTRSLLSRDKAGYFFFAHRSVWEIIMARLLFAGYKVNYDGRAEQYEEIQDFYNQMCWREIVPAGRFPSLAPQQQRQVLLYDDDAMAKWFRRRDGFGFHDGFIHTHGNLPERILEFKDPAVRALFLGLEAEELTAVSREISLFEWYKHMLHCWMQKDGLGKALFLGFLQPLIARAQEHILNSDGFFQGNLSSVFREQFSESRISITPDDYLAQPYALFAPGREGAVYFRHKSILDFLLVDQGEGLPLAFKDHYTSFYPFALDEWGKRSGCDLQSETLQIKEKKGLLLLHYHYDKSLPRNLYLEQLGLEDISILSGFPEVRVLYLSENNITDITPLSKLKKLRLLDLHNNMIDAEEQELKPLLQLLWLTFLNLHGNPLAEGVRQLLEASNRENCLFVLRKHLLDNPRGLVYVEGGTFMMGWLNKQRDGGGLDWEKPAHKLKLTPFSIGQYPVTFEEYDAFCEATGREKPNGAGWGRGRRPVMFVDWYDAVEYCNWLSEIWGLEQVYEIDKNYDDKKWLVTVDENANGYRLPTEAEWEYAARGGQKSKGYLYAGGNELDEVGWYSGNSGAKTHPVGEKQPNELGLYDMSGNVYEWCWDWFADDYYQSSPEGNPRGPGQGSDRVIRGGNHILTMVLCRVAYRNGCSPTFGPYVGFRLARSLEAASSYEPPVK